MYNVPMPLTQRNNDNPDHAIPLAKTKDYCVIDEREEWHNLQAVEVSVKKMASSSSFLFSLSFSVLITLYTRCCAA